MYTSLAVHNTLFFGYMYPSLQTYIFFCFFCVKFLTLAVYNFLTLSLQFLNISLTLGVFFCSMFVPTKTKFNLNIII